MRKERNGQEGKEIRPWNVRKRVGVMVKDGGNNQG